MRDINSEKRRSKKQEVILRNEYQPALFRKVHGGFLAWLSVAIMAVVIVVGYLLYPANNLLQSYEAGRAEVDIYKMPFNPAISAEIDVLKGQLIGLISGSIESKLRVLEANVRSGKVGAKDIGVIEDLKNDLQVLKTYSATGAGRLIAEPYVEKGSQQREMSNQLLNEVSQLKQLIYLSLASCGLMFSAICGVWIRHSLRLQRSPEHKTLSGKN